MMQYFIKCFLIVMLLAGILLAGTEKKLSDEEEKYLPFLSTLLYLTVAKENTADIRPYTYRFLLDSFHLKNEEVVRFLNKYQNKPESWKIMLQHVIVYTDSLTAIRDTSVVKNGKKP